MCRLPADIRIKGNKAEDKTAKKGTSKPGIASTKLPYIDYYPANKVLAN